MEKLTFTIDRITITEGDIVELHWDCPGSTATTLTIDNGYKTSTLQLDTAGSKRFRLNRSKGRTKLTLIATVNGKQCSKTIKVTVKELPVTKAETVDQRGRTMSRLRQWFDMRRWRSLFGSYRQAKQAQPKEKRLASRILLILCGIMMLSMFSLTLLPIGIIALGGYLIWVLLKR